LQAVTPGRVEPYLVNARMGDWDTFRRITQQTEDADSTYASMQREGVQYLVLCYRDAPTACAQFRPDSPFRQQYLTPVADADGMALLKVQKRSAGDAPAVRDLIEESVAGWLRPGRADKPEFLYGLFCQNEPTWGVALRAGRDYTFPLTVPPHSRVEATVIID